MTIEEDFRAALNERPDDFQLRLMYADWLEEQGDVRASGYRAMGILGLRPYNAFVWFNETEQENTWTNSRYAVYSDLPDDWFNCLAGGEFRSTPLQMRYEIGKGLVTADDAAALAFAKLPPERQAELLKVPVLC